MEAKTEITTMEGNKLIADFMGLQHQMEDWCGCNAMQYQEWCSEYEMLPYNPEKDWNVLMPVVQKILKTDTGTLDVYSLYVSDALTTADIKRVWGSVIDFIQWYNKNNQ